jgi:hypothetical protein
LETTSATLKKVVERKNLSMVPPSSTARFQGTFDILATEVSGATGVGGQIVAVSSSCSDGEFLYVHLGTKIFKISSGLSWDEAISTIPGNCIGTITNDVEFSYVAFMNDMLFCLVNKTVNDYDKSQDESYKIKVYNPKTLEVSLLCNLFF